MNISPYERETIINYNEEDGEADVYTCSKPVMRMLDKLCALHLDTYRRIKRDDYHTT